MESGHPLPSAGPRRLYQPDSLLSLCDAVAAPRRTVSGAVGLAVAATPRYVSANRTTAIYHVTGAVLPTLSSHLCLDLHLSVFGATSGDMGADYRRVIA